MMSKKILVLATVLASVSVCCSVALAGIVSNELTPAEDIFSGPDTLDPYYLVLRNRLLGEHRYRKCQVLSIPSFQREWATYLVRVNGRSEVVIKIMSTPLWSEMMRVLSDDGKRKSYSLSAVSQSEALARVPEAVETSRFSISEETADVLEMVWSMALARTKYSETTGLGLDGVTYHVSHWDQRHFFRSATTWSPEKDTIPGALVEIAETIRKAQKGQETSQFNEPAVREMAAQLVERLRVPSREKQ